METPFLHFLKQLNVKAICQQIKGCVLSLPKHRKDDIVKDNKSYANCASVILNKLVRRDFFKTNKCSKSNTFFNSNVH